MTALPRLRDSDEASFEQDLRAGSLVLVKFTAQWCPPCRAIEPMLKQLCAERPALHVIRVDVDSQPAIAQRFGVRALPTLIAFRAGTPFGQLVGAPPRRALERLLNS